jgi:hypothetical protein
MFSTVKKAINSHPFVIFVDPNQNVIQIIENDYFPDPAVSSSAIKVIDSQSSIQEFKNFFSDVEINPIVGETKLYIINNFDQMNYLKANVLLKLIDENLSNNKIIGVAISSQKILDTVKSRSIIVNLPDNQDYDLALEEIIRDNKLFDLIEYLDHNNDAYTQLYKLINNSRKISQKKIIHLSECLDLVLTRIINNELIAIKLLKEK